MEIIPAGRIMFVPAFVVRASQGEQAKVGQDTRLNAPRANISVAVEQPRNSISSLTLHRKGNLMFFSIAFVIVITFSGIQDCSRGKR